jgi:hypothetical protein
MRLPFILYPFFQDLKTDNESIHLRLFQSIRFIGTNGKGTPSAKVENATILEVTCKEFAGLSRDRCR